MTVTIVAGFTMSSDPAFAGDVVTFTDTSQGTVTTRLWDFGDGTGSTEANPTHVYETSGPHTVTLVVNGPGGPQVISQSINVRLKASFTPSALSVSVGEPVVFTDSSHGTITSWSWNFGDGTGSSAQSPLHAFATPGVYPVTLTVNGPGSPPASATVSVTVSAIVPD